MIEDRITPVILCGGFGARLWPRSRPAAPKPFLPLVGSETLFQQTLQRCRDCGFGKPIVVTGATHVDLVDSQSAGFDLAEIVVEPEARHTAAAVALAALRLPADAVMLVCPSDHHIGDRAAFREASLAAADLAAAGYLACLAVPATGPATRFGYVRPGEQLGPSAFRVLDFVEKPDITLARDFLGSGSYAWNAGIFALRAADYLDELAAHRPDIATAVRGAVAAGRKSGRHFLPEPAKFNHIDGESIDRAVMENTKRAAMVISNMGWSDIGDWQSLKQVRDKDENGNCVRGPAELIGCRDVLIDSDGPRVRAAGLENVVIIVDGDDILVATADAACDFGSSAN
jgi:mannose-1-phosphate guanylyltransferase